MTTSTKLRSLFREYYRPSEEEFRKMWEECYFIFDSCVLLNLYEYSEETTNDLFTLLNLIKDRIWLPHQVGVEFLRDRLNVIFRQKSAYQKIISALENAMESFNETYKKANLQPTHRYIDSDSVLKKVSKKVELIKAEIRKLSKEHPEWPKKDDILDKVTELFEDDRHGEPFDEETYKNVCKEADTRYASSTPPGYMDAQKDNEDKTKQRKYGDYIIWKQIISFAKKNKKSIIFVTDDVKEDWWKLKDKTNKTILSPREELIKEMFEVAGVDYYSYQTNKFIEFARDIFNLQIGEDTIEEIKDVGREVKQSTGFSIPMVIGSGVIGRDYILGDDETLAGTPPEKKVGSKPDK